MWNGDQPLLRRVFSASIKTWVALPLVGLALAFPASPGSARALDFAPCGEPDGILCATITVPLDRSGKIPGSIGIFMHKKPATSGKSSGALFYLIGGPGFSGTAQTSSAAAELGPELQTRDLYTIDYRGVGLSGALACPFATPTDADWRRCAEALPARHLYTAREIAEDIEDVRRTLGLARISIFAESYGTKFAQAYALRYGDHIDRLVLDSVVPVNGWDALDLPTWRSFGRILREICTAGRCRGITRDPLADLASLAARALKKPFDVSYVKGDGTVARHTFTWQYDFTHIFNSNLVMSDHVVRARWPSAVRSALAGDTYPLGRLLAIGLQEVAAHGSAEANGVAFRATHCEELASAPWRGVTGLDRRVKAVTDAVNALPADTAYPFPRDLILWTPEATICGYGWSEASTPPLIQPRTRFTGPTLIVSGTQDMRTPLEDARTAATLFPGSTLLAVPDMGHVPSPSLRTPKCALTALDDFFAGRAVGTCQATVEPLFPPAPVAPASLAKVRSWPGIRGARGKTLRAALETVLDVRYTAYSQAAHAGLRGGTFTTTATPGTINGRPANFLDKVTLKSIVYVRGVVVSGVVDAPGGIGTITIAGSSVRGTLKIANGRVTGRLGGKPVTVAYKPLLLGVLNRR